VLVDPAKRDITQPSRFFAGVDAASDCLKAFICSSLLCGLFLCPQRGKFVVERFFLRFQDVGV